MNPFYWYLFFFSGELRISSGGLLPRALSQVDDEHPEWLGAEPRESHSARAAAERDAARTEFDVPEDLRDYSIS